ncbi:DUF1566 domain-containing protein [Parabacteroides faecis]|uniref:DUF4906 domain-containing protein n=1 Tax=Parabacteroides faecis TaxID=1217282 RepID=UPI0021648BF3|nr:DUF4906 domain-containing protein [Parabacteroides faecis]MCS2893546.1 DUF1566 domain-containing protein [Parabacteroides faecis]UVQ47858.1 DUF1566 domain-containing protein [Parabacteroides faecis]
MESPLTETVDVKLGMSLEIPRTPGAESKATNARHELYRAGITRVIASELTGALLAELIEEPLDERSLLPRQTRAVNDSQIANLWVFQYNDTGADARLIRKDYYTSYSTGMNIKLITGISQRVVVVANTSDATFSEDLPLNSSTFQSLLDKSTTVSDEADLLTNGGHNLPMSGMFTGNIADGILVNIPMQRNVSKVNFRVKTGNVTADNWTIQLCNVPDKSYWMAQREDATFPISVTPVSYTEQAVNGMNTTTFKEFSWFVPVNRRGTVDGTTSKQRAVNAPAEATYVKVTGSKRVTNTVYTIHLGMNFTTDYNLDPNYKYTYQVTLYTDPCETDSRVKMESFDYTDNETPWFGVATEDCNSNNAPGVVLSSNRYTWNNAALACAVYSQDGIGAGSWRLPTQWELMLMWIYKGELGSFTSSYYWSIDENSSNTNNVWCVHFINGTTFNFSKAAIYPVRCVRDL